YDSMVSRGSYVEIWLSGVPNECIVFPELSYSGDVLADCGECCFERNEFVLMWRNSFISRGENYFFRSDSGTCFRFQPDLIFPVFNFCDPGAIENLKPFLQS